MVDIKLSDTKEDSILRVKSMCIIGTDIASPQYSFNVFISTLRPRQNGCHIADNIFKFIFCFISSKSVPKGPIDNIPEFIRIMAWSRPGEKPLFDPMIVRSPKHVCVTGPHWVEKNNAFTIIWSFWYDTNETTYGIRELSPAGFD